MNGRLIFLTRNLKIQKKVAITPMSLSYELQNLESDYSNSSEFHVLLENVCNSILRTAYLKICSIQMKLLRLETSMHPFYAPLIYFDFLKLT